MHANKEHILIIKHGALGDIILCSGVLKTIREHHADAHITVLTTKAFAGLFKQMGWFDEIWVDERAKWHQFGKVKALVKLLRSKSFTRVYDLQTSQRSSSYLRLFKAPKPEFSGIAKDASHRHHSPERTSMHTIDRQAEQMRLAGIDTVHTPDISWMKGQGDLQHPQQPYALIVAGGSAHRPEKRYPEKHYISLCEKMLEVGLKPVLIGHGAEESLLHSIASAVPDALNLCNQTSYGDIADLARAAACAVGNDTGPMHIIAATECPSIVLFSNASNPDLCAPRGDHVCVMQHDNLALLSPIFVMHAVKDIRRS